MRFVLNIASNCDINQKVIQDSRFQEALDAEFKRVLALCCASFFCLCCLIDVPSKSLLIDYHQQLGIPPVDLQAPVEGSQSFYVISLETSNEKTPLFFSENMQIALLLLDELLQVYCFEAAMVDANSKILDSKARLWHQIYYLPPISKYSAL